MKKRVVASQWFRSVDGALNTIACYEAMNMIRKGQIRWLPKADPVGRCFIERLFGSLLKAQRPLGILARRVCCLPHFAYIWAPG